MPHHYEEVLRFPLFAMNCIGLKPTESKNNVLSFFIPGCYVLVGFLSILDVAFTGEINFEAVVKLVWTLFVMSHWTMVTSTFFINRRKWSEIILNMKHLWPVTVESFDDDKPRNESLATLKFVKKFYKSAVAYVLTCGTSLMFLQVLTRNPSFTFYVPKLVPAGFSKTIMYVLSIITATSGGLITITFSGLYISIVSLVYVQLKMINSKLGSLKFGYGGTTEAEYNEIIASCVQHHNFLLRQVKLINSGFGPALMAIFGNYMMITCFMMCVFNDLTVDPEAAFIVMAIIEMWMEMFFFIIVPGAMLADEASKLCGRIYLTNWHECPYPSVKKSLLMIMTRAQRRTVIYVGYQFAIDFEMCIRIAKSTFSYQTFLRSMNESIM